MLDTSFKIFRIRLELDDINFELRLRPSGTSPVVNAGIRLRDGNLVYITQMSSIPEVNCASTLLLWLQQLLKPTNIFLIDWTQVTQKHCIHLFLALQWPWDEVSLTDDVDILKLSQFCSAAAWYTCCFLYIAILCFYLNSCNYMFWSNHIPSSSHMLLLSGSFLEIS